MPPSGGGVGPDAVVDVAPKVLRELAVDVATDGVASQISIDHQVHDRRGGRQRGGAESLRCSCVGGGKPRAEQRGSGDSRVHVGKVADAGNKFNPPRSPPSWPDKIPHPPPTN